MIILTATQVSSRAPPIRATIRHHPGICLFLSDRGSVSDSSDLCTFCVCLVSSAASRILRSFPRTITISQYRGLFTSPRRTQIVHSHGHRVAISYCFFCLLLSASYCHRRRSLPSSPLCRPDLHIYMGTFISFLVCRIALSEPARGEASCYRYFTGVGFTRLGDPTGQANCKSRRFLMSGSNIPLMQEFYILESRVSVALPSASHSSACDRLPSECHLQKPTSIDDDLGSSLILVLSTTMVSLSARGLIVRAQLTTTMLIIVCA